MPRETVDLVVLDAIADDVESIELILNRLNGTEFGWRKLRDGASYTRADLVPALLRLIRDGLAEAFRSEPGGLVRIGASVMPSGDMDEYWFGITPYGRMLHASWEPGEPAE